MDGKLATVNVEKCCEDSLYISSWFVRRPGTNIDGTLWVFPALFNDILDGNCKKQLRHTYKIHPGGRQQNLGFQ